MNCVVGLWFRRLFFNGSSCPYDAQEGENCGPHECNGERENRGFSHYEVPVATELIACHLRPVRDGDRSVEGCETRNVEKRAL